MLQNVNELRGLGYGCIYGIAATGHGNLDELYRI
jgi:hypothetical protein